MASSSFQRVYIADGFVDDCEELIQRCLQTEMLTFSHFCHHWKEMKFAYIFQGRSSGAELAEFTEEAIHIAKRYMVSNTSNYEESVAGLFIVYALLKLQPFAGFAPLRLTPPDLDAVYCLEDVARRRGRADVLLILGKVLIEGPCQFHAADRPYGMDRAVRKYCQVTTTIERLGARAKGVFYRQNEELDLLRELSSIGRRYTRCKANIYGYKRPDKTLDYMDEHLPNEMAASLKQLIVGSSGNAQRTEDDPLQSIKQKAMRDAVQGMRHLTGLDQRAQTSNTASGEKEESHTVKKKKKSKSKRSKEEISSGTEISLDEDGVSKRKRKYCNARNKTKETNNEHNGTLQSDKNNISTSNSQTVEVSDQTNKNLGSKQSLDSNKKSEGTTKSPRRKQTSPKKADKSPKIKLKRTRTKKQNGKNKNSKKDAKIDVDSNSSDEYSIASSGETNISDYDDEDNLASLPTIDDYINMSSRQNAKDKPPVHKTTINEESCEKEITNTNTEKSPTKRVKKLDKSPPKRNEKIGANLRNSRRRNNVI